jgi:hypothetical protein
VRYFGKNFVLYGKIPATGETENGKISAQHQTRQNISETPISINKLGLVMLRCIPSQLGGIVRGSWSKAEKIKRISL